MHRKTTHQNGTEYIRKDFLCCKWEAQIAVLKEYKDGKSSCTKDTKEWPQRAQKRKIGKKTNNSEGQQRQQQQHEKTKRKQEKESSNEIPGIYTELFWLKKKTSFRSLGNGTKGTMYGQQPYLWPFRERKTFLLHHCDITWMVSVLHQLHRLHHRREKGHQVKLRELQRLVPECEYEPSMKRIESTGRRGLVLAREEKRQYNQIKGEELFIEASPKRKLYAKSSRERAVTFPVLFFLALSSAQLYQGTIG